MKSILKNLSWLLSDNVFSIAIGFATSIIVVRYLGPENNGLLNYCVAYASLWSAFADMGAANIIQKEEVIGKIKTNILVGTGLVIGMVGGMLTTIGTIATLVILDESKEIILCGILIASSYIFKSIYVIKYVLLARLQADKFVKTNIKVQLVMSMIKIGLVFGGGSIFAFAGCYCLEALLQAIFYIKIYKENIGKIENISFSIKVFIKILRQSWPYIIASFAIVIYMKSDQIMIGRMLGNKVVGIYSVAVTISGVAQFLPAAIASTMLPGLTTAYKENSEKFESVYIDYFEKIIILMFSIIILLLVFSSPIIFSAYGEEYMVAVPIIRIYAISELFSAIGVAEGAYINIYGLQKKSMKVTCMAAAANIILNAILIPRYGCEGAAFATIVAMLMQSILFYCFWQDTRNLVKMLGKALLFRNSLYQFHSLCEKLNK